MANPLDIYARATRRLPLTPGERALLRTADQLLLSALAGALLAVVQTLAAGGQQLSLATIGQVALYAGASALITGLAKLFRARGDSFGQTVASALDQEAGRIPAPRGYKGAPSGPISAQQRAAIMAQARATVASNPELGVVSGGATRPVAAVPAADVAATQAQGAQTVTDTPTAQISLSARSTTSAADDATGDGPPAQQVTQRMTALRPAMGTAIQTADAWTTAG